MEKRKLIHTINDAFRKHEDFIRGRENPLTPNEAYPIQSKPLFDPKDLIDSYQTFLKSNEYRMRNNLVCDESADALFKFLYQQKQPEKK